MLDRFFSPGTKLCRLHGCVERQEDDARAASAMTNMRPPTPREIIEAAWITFAVYWFWAARNQKRVQRSEPLLLRFSHILFMACGFVLLYSRDPYFTALNQRFIPERPWIEMLGALLTAAGVGFAIWARRHIGKNWSAEVTIRQEHNLIRTGPYARIRHPIYTGLLVAVGGTAIAIGEYRTIVAFVFILVGFSIKAKREELLLTKEFGPAFDEHRRQTGFFLPR
jgi:protein-S-isoprenylcysteine O-methyltransferase Ste14